MIHFILFLIRWPFFLAALLLVFPLVLMAAIGGLDDDPLHSWWAAVYEVLYLDWRKR